MIQYDTTLDIYNCLDTDLIADAPPLVDEGGGVIPDHQLCEVMDSTTLKVTRLFKKKEGVWYEY